MCPTLSKGVERKVMTGYVASALQGGSFWQQRNIVLEAESNITQRLFSSRYC